MTQEAALLILNVSLLALLNKRRVFERRLSHGDLVWHNKGTSERDEPVGGDLSDLIGFSC